MARRIIYIKNPSSGSHFRILGGGGGGGGGRPGGGGPVNPPGNGGIKLPTWVFQPPPARAPNTDHTNPPPTRPIHMGGFNPPQYMNFSININVGIASPGDWLTSFSNANLGAFNLLSPTLGWNPTSWNQFFFADTVFSKEFWKKTKIGNQSGSRGSLIGNTFPDNPKMSWTNTYGYTNRQDGTKAP